MSDDYKKHVSKWIEENRRGFYLGCRIDAHSGQVNEFADGLNYYLKKEGIPEIEKLSAENARLLSELAKMKEALREAYEIFTQEKANCEAHDKYHPNTMKKDKNGRCILYECYEADRWLSHHASLVEPATEKLGEGK